MSERIIADPSEVATGRTELDLTPWIKADGIDYGDAEIAAYMADMGYGSSPVDFRVPNRQITIPLSLRAQGGTSFATARQNIQAKIGRWQQEGGWLKRVTAAGGTLYADVVNASVHLPGGWSQAHKDYDVEASLTLEALPDFYGNEVTLSDHVETSAAELVFTESDVDGDYPARVRVVVDEDQGQSQLGLMWGFQSKNYSSAATAALAYEAEALQPLDTAAKAALSGASGGTVVTHGTLATNWTPVLNLNLAGTAFLTHTGTYRMFCRYRTTAGTAVALRSVYDVGDLVSPIENPPWYHPASTAGTAFYTADLGELRLQQGPVGTHRWAGQIQGKGLVGSENVSLDRVWFQPVDESAGLLRAAISADPGLAAYSARSEFTTESGAITGDSLTVGGTWGNALGDTDDFSAASGVITRATASDTAIGTIVEGRALAAGTTSLAAVAAQIDFKRNNATAAGTISHGLILRYVNSTNFLLAWVDTAAAMKVWVAKCVAGAETYLSPGVTFAPFTFDTFRTLRVVVDATGRIVVWVYTQNSVTGEPVCVLQDPVLATGGTLASGKVGIFDGHGSTGTPTRTYGNFAAWVPTTDAVLNASQSAELRTDGMFREDSGGTASGPVSWVEGDLPRLPVSGLEGRTVRGMVKASRGDFGSLPDTGIDDISGRLSYRPCWLNVPGT